MTLTLRKFSGFLSILVLTLLTLTGCVKNEFQVEFKLPAGVNESYTMLYYVSDSEKGWLYDQVAVLQQGKCQLKGITRNPTLIYVFQGAQDPGVVIYAERGDKIEITGDSGSPASWAVSGNEINEALSAWRADNRNALSARDNKKVNEAVAKYVKANPEDPVSTILLEVYYDRSIDPAGFDSLFKSLKGKAADVCWMELMSRSDLLGGFEPLKQTAAPLILRTAGNGADTIGFNEQPALLYFSYNNYDTRKDDVSKMKQLLKERTDSGKPQIVSISLENDSSGWRYQARMDSLKGAVVAWMPLSFADPAAVSLGLEKAPCFIVVGKKGKILYRGTSLDDAARKLRDAAGMKKKAENK